MLRKNSVMVKKKRKQRSCWARPWLLRRAAFGHYETLLQELAAEDPPAFRNYTRVDLEMFHELEDLLYDKIVKKRTLWREPISPACRLATSAPVEPQQATVELKTER
jgi:hypothetical protein